MPKVNITRENRKKSRLRHYILDEMRQNRVTQAVMGELLGISQQGFNYKLKNCSFTYLELLIIFDALNVNQKDMCELLSINL